MNETESLEITYTYQVGLVVKNSPVNAEDIRDVVQSLDWKDSLGGWHGSPHQYSGESHGERSLIGYSP